MSLFPKCLYLPNMSLKPGAKQKLGPCGDWVYHPLAASSPMPGKSSLWNPLWCYRHCAGVFGDLPGKWRLWIWRLFSFRDERQSITQELVRQLSPEHLSTNHICQPKPNQPPSLGDFFPHPLLLQNRLNENKCWKPRVLPKPQCRSLFLPLQSRHAESVGTQDTTEMWLALFAWAVSVMRWARQLNSYLCKLSSSSNSFSPCAMICSHRKSRLTPCSINPTCIVQMLCSQGCTFLLPFHTHLCMCTQSNYLHLTGQVQHTFICSTSFLQCSDSEHLWESQQKQLVPSESSHIRGIYAVSFHSYSSLHTCAQRAGKALASKETEPS